MTVRADRGARVAAAGAELCYNTGVGSPAAAAQTVLAKAQTQTFL